MWPVAGQSTLEAMWVLDWGTAQHDVSTGGVVAGGFSMGADTYRAGRDRPTRGVVSPPSGRTLAGHDRRCAIWTPAAATPFDQGTPVLTVLARRPVEPHRPRRELRSCIPHRSSSPPPPAATPPIMFSATGAIALCRNQGDPIRPTAGPHPCRSHPAANLCGGPGEPSAAAVSRKGDGRLGPSDLLRRTATALLESLLR